MGFFEGEMIQIQKSQMVADIGMLPKPSNSQEMKVFWGSLNLKYNNPCGHCYFEGEASQGIFINVKYHLESQQ